MNTVTRKRAVLHGALSHAVELGLLPANPISRVQWRAPRATVAANPATIASPAQIRAILSRSGTAWTSTGEPHEARGLKHRPDGMNYVVPNPPVPVPILHRPTPHRMRYAFASTSWMPGHPG